MKDVYDTYIAVGYVCTIGLMLGACHICIIYIYKVFTLCPMAMNLSFSLNFPKLSLFDTHKTFLNLLPFVLVVSIDHT